MFRFSTRNLVFLVPNRNHNLYRSEESITNSIHLLHTLIVKSGDPNTCNSRKQHLTTISYLKNKCGLSLDSAVLASKNVTITNTQKADLVLQLLKSYDFTQPQISNLITKCPSLIQSDPDKTLKPKFEYLESLGLSNLDVSERFLYEESPTFIRSDPKLESTVQTPQTDRVPEAKNQHLTTVVYLKNRCGLSLDSAVLASKKVTITCTQKADSVLQLFKSYDFAETHITTLITKCPSLIQSDPVKTLKPRFEFLESLGLSKRDITKLFFSGKCPAYILSDTNKMEQNVAVLRNYGMPDSSISKLLMVRPLAFVLRNDIFRTRLGRLDEMGFCPKSLNFFRAVHVVISATGKLWEKKLDVFKSVGWSDKDIIAAFRKQPRYITSSEEKVRLLMDFYLNKLGLNLSDVAKCPNLLMLSFEKRIIPRCSVLNFLLSKGLISDLNMVSALNVMKGTFAKMFVTKYREMFPEIMSLFQDEKENSKL